MTQTFGTYDSPVGELLLRASESGLTGVWFPGRGGLTPGPRPGVREEGPAAAILSLTHHQLDQYFAGTRTTFDIPLEPQGSPFELRVWDLLRTIPHGTTTTYGDLARRLGDPKLSRAVGAANGKNPIPIIVPCHRVIGADGSLTGFGGGLDRKRWLLEHEGALMRLGPA